MGYESTIYFVRPFKELKGECEIIASLEMCNMGHTRAIEAFKKLFDTPIDFKLFMPECDEDYKKCLVSEDKYGEPLKTGDTDKMYEAIKTVLYEDPEYWRFNILKDMLFAFRPYKDVYVVHYGH